MAFTKAYRAAQVCAQASTLVLAAAIAGCGASSKSLYPETPKWSLTDKQPLGAASGQPGPPQGPQPYEYRGGRDPVTGQARATQGAPPVRQVAPAQTSVPPASREASLGQLPRTVEIRKGDTLHGLSLQHHISVKALMDANNLTTTTIVPGKKLVIPKS